jgi:lipopolysaccharide biosynthesis glycosyltransferase
MQARQHAPAAQADVAIFSFGASTTAAQAFARACAAEGIRFVPVAAETIEGANAMLARLFLSRFAGPDYEQFLYIDGDTQINGSLSPLITESVPEGRFLAASDPMVFAISDQTPHDRDISAYFKSLGISLDAATGYFNTGVLRINRHGWDALGQAAWGLFQRQHGASKFPDQDALNMVSAGRRMPMSLAWNFPVFMCNAGVEASIQPRIYHFMGNPKPWYGAFAPWGQAGHAPYVEAILKYPGLAEYLPVMPRWKKFRYVLQQQYRKRLEARMWRDSDKRLRILGYESKQ